MNDNEALIYLIRHHNISYCNSFNFARRARHWDVSPTKTNGKRIWTPEHVAAFAVEWKRRRPTSSNRYGIVVGNGSPAMSTRRMNLRAAIKSLDYPVKSNL